MTSKWTIVFENAKDASFFPYDQKGRVVWTESRERAEVWLQAYNPDRKDVRVVDAEHLVVAPHFYFPGCDLGTLELSPASEEQKEHTRALAALPHPHDLLEAQSWLRLGAPAAHRDYDAPVMVRTLLALIKELPHFIDLYCWGSAANKAAYAAFRKDDEKE